MSLSDALAIVAILLVICGAFHIIRKNCGRSCGNGCNNCPYAKDCEKRSEIKSKERQS